MTYLPKINRFITLLFLFISNLACADSIVDIFSPKPITQGTDKSLILLGQIFGTVDGVLSGQGSQILGSMFGIFNAAVVGVGGLIILYAIITATVNTANEGEALGHKWNSMWIPLRIAFGTALIIPKASGYSMIQIFIMWVIVQGVGAADTLWMTTLNYIDINGRVMVNGHNVDDTKKISAFAQKILAHQVCLHFIQSTWNNQLNYKPNIYIQPSYPRAQDLGTDCVTPLTAKGAQKNVCSFFPDPATLPVRPNPDHNLSSLTCGFLSWPDKTTATDPKPTTEDVVTAGAKIDAVWQMVLDLDPYAQQIVDNPSGVDAAAIQFGVQNATLDFMNIMYPAFARARLQAQQQEGAEMNSKAPDGWIMAGSYYSYLAGLSSGSNQSLSGYIDSISDHPPIMDTTKTGNVPSVIGDSNVTAYNAAIDDVNNINISSINSNVSSNSSANAEALNHGNVAGYLSGDMIAAGGIMAISGAAGLAAPVLIAISAGLIGIEATWITIFRQHDIDPIVAVMSMGNALVETVGWWWLTLGIASFFIGLGAGILSCTNPLYWAFQAVMMWIIPFITVIMTLLFTAGAIMAYYIPLIPFIVFLFGAMGWFIATIESMVAAPLVALGIIYPDGQHDVWGRADPAVMLIVNVFLRPSLMIIGFIAAILLSYVSLKLLCWGFGPAFETQSTTGDSNGLFSQLFRGVGLIVIFTAIVMLIVQKSFQLINEVPKNVMRWIGGQDQLGDGTTDLSSVQGAVSTGAQGAAKSLGDSTAQTGPKAQEASKADAQEKKQGGGGSGGSSASLQSGTIPP